jgi:hypothetical protein
MRRLGIGVGERGEHALVLGRRARRRQHQAVEIVGEAALAVEILDQAPLPRRREVECADQGGEQRDVAHADRRLGEAVMRGRLEREGERLGVGCRSVGAAERLDADLEEFRRAVLALAEHRAEVAEFCGLAGGRRGEVVARDRDGEVGPEAELAACGVVDQVHAAADVLARQIEERLGRLQQRRRDARVAGALVRGDERIRAQVLCRLGHGRLSSSVQSLAAPV